MQKNSFNWSTAVAVFVFTTGCAAQAPAPSEPIHVSSACSTVGRADAHALLLKRENIVSVAPLSEKPRVAARNPLARIRAEEHAKRVGVRLAVKAAPGLTSEWLQTLANCDRSLPPEDHAEGIVCPFELANSSANVISLGGAFAIDVTSDDPAVVDEAIRRAEALAQ